MSTTETDICTCAHCGTKFERPHFEIPSILDSSLWDGLQDLCDPCSEAEQKAFEKAQREQTARAEWEATVVAEYRNTDETHPDFPRDIHRACQQWLAGRGIGKAEHLLFLGLIGESGTGKTRVVSRMVRRLIWQGSRVVWLNSARFQWACQNQFNDDQKEEAARCLSSARKARWLVLDDIGSLKSTEAVTDSLYSILEHRSSSMLPLIWTSNETIDEMIPKAPAKSRARILSRLGGFSNIIANTNDHPPEGSGE